MGKKGGRPTIFSEELVATICARIAGGESLNAICRDPAMPDKTSVFLWLGKPEYEWFSHLYAKATQERAEHLFDEMFEIADDGKNDYLEILDKDGGCIGYKLNGEFVARSKLRVDVRKWALSKMVPKKYGDAVRTEITGANGGPVAVEQTNRTDQQIIEMFASKLKEVEKNT